MKKLKAIIVDDEQDSRETLQNYVHKYCPNVSVVALADRISVASEKIKIYQPDFLFLDIEMPFGNAFDLLDSLEEVNFEIIFVTAFSQYAVQAFNLSAAHYLQKPVDIDELIDAVQKVAERLETARKINSSQILMDNLSAINTQHQKVVLPQLDGFSVSDSGKFIFVKQ